MELRHLRYFAALAECLNFTRAAQRMHVTQSTLSHQIRQLEEELGQPLFDRIGRRVLLTEAGESFLGYAAKALREVDQGLNELRSGSAALSGELRIGATPTFSMEFLPECLARFMARHPEVKIVAEELSAQDIASGLLAERLDLGVSYQPAETDALWFEPLRSEEMVLVVGRSHPFAQRRRVRMVELHRQPLVLLTPGFATRRLLDECFRHSGAEPLVAVEMNAVMPMLGLVARTGLATIVSEHALPLRGDLVAVPLEEPTPVRTPGLLWKQRPRQSAALRALAAEIRRMALRRSRRTADPDAAAGAA